MFRWQSVAVAFRWVMLELGVVLTCFGDDNVAVMDGIMAIVSTALRLAEGKYSLASTAT